MTPSRVCALYIDPRGPYPKLLGPEMCWDEKRDARTYAGPWPLVAHPPCGAWSSLRHLYSGDSKECGPLAVEAVRRFGGVVEHPATSTMFAELGLPRPGELPDQFGGRTVEVRQCDWGHPAEKRTFLYFVGGQLPPMPPRREPTHWCSGTHTPGQRGTVPPGIKVCSAQQRRRTPEAFARWLISLAQQVNIAKESA